MERVCEDRHDIEALQAKLFMARLHTTDISLIPTTYSNFLQHKIQGTVVACVSVTVY